MVFRCSQCARKNFSRKSTRNTIAASSTKSPKTDYWIIWSLSWSVLVQCDASAHFVCLFVRLSCLSCLSLSIYMLLSLNLSLQLSLSLPLSSSSLYGSRSPQFALGSPSFLSTDPSPAVLRHHISLSVSQLFLLLNAWTWCMFARFLWQAKGGNIVEFHSCELFPERWFDMVRVHRPNRES